MAFHINVVAPSNMDVQSIAPNFEVSAGRGIAFVDAGAISLGKVKIAAPERSLCVNPTQFKSDEPRCTLVLQLSGIATFTTQKRSVQLAPGNWEALDVSPLSIRTDGHSAEQLLILMPQALLGTDIHLAETRLYRLSAASELSKLLCQAAVCLLDELALTGVRRSEELSDALCQIVRLAVQKRFHSEPLRLSGLEKARWRAKQFVESSLRDPLLSVDAIAARMNCTSRYLQKAFQSNGQTLRDYVRNERLSRCYKDLLDSTLSDRSITDIALSWGFKSVAHFSEAFRKRYGIAPRAARWTKGLRAINESLDLRDSNCMPAPF